MNTREFQIIFDGDPMKQSEYYKRLGVYIDNFPIWNKHITYIKSKFIQILNCATKFPIFIAAMFC
jgi:hypothetical protein